MSDVGVGRIPLSLIKENPVALRPVNKKSEEYMELVGSIRERGVINPVSVRELIDPGTGTKYYGLIDGLHRFTASKDAGLDDIPAYVTSMGDADVEEAQIIANIHKIETKAAEYSKQLMRMLARNPLMTESELAKKLSKSTAWLRDRLSLDKLNPKIQELVNDDSVGLSNAYALAKLPEEEQLDFLDRAQTQDPQEFCPAVHARVKEIRDARRQGKDAEPVKFQPQAFLQKLGDIKTEMEKGEIARALISANGAKTAEEGFNLGVAWCLHMDPQSQAAQIAKDEARKAKAKAEAEARKKEREEKKAANAASKTADVREAVASS